MLTILHYYTNVWINNKHRLQFNTTNLWWRSNSRILTVLWWTSVCWTINIPTITTIIISRIRHDNDSNVDTATRCIGTEEADKPQNGNGISQRYPATSCSIITRQLLPSSTTELECNNGPPCKVGHFPSCSIVTRWRDQQAQQYSTAHGFSRHIAEFAICRRICCLLWITRNCPFFATHTYI